MLHFPASEQCPVLLCTFPRQNSAQSYSALSRVSLVTKLCTNKFALYSKAVFSPSLLHVVKIHVFLLFYFLYYKFHSKSLYSKHVTCGAKFSYRFSFFWWREKTEIGKIYQRNHSIKNLGCRAVIHKPEYFGSTRFHPCSHCKHRASLRKGGAVIRFCIYTKAN